MRNERLLRIIKESTELLDEGIQRHGTAILEDKFLLLAALHALQVASQALIDLAAHIISEAGAAVPSSYSEIPRILKREGCLSDPEAELFRRIIGFRNVVVHQYSSVDLEIVRKILEGKLYKDIEKLALSLIKWAQEKGIDP